MLLTAIVVIIALALRLDGLHRGLEYDEIHPFEVYGQLSPVEAFSVRDSADSPNFHPLNNMLVTLAPDKIDGSEARYRLWVMLFGLALVGVAAAVVYAETQSRYAALAAAALCATHPILVHFSQTARGYAIQQCLGLALCGWMFCAHRFRDKRYVPWVIGVVVLALLVEASVISGVLLIAPIFTPFLAEGLLAYRAKRITKPDLIRCTIVPLAAASLALGLLLLWFLPLFQQTAGIGRQES